MSILTELSSSQRTEIVQQLYSVWFKVQRYHRAIRDSAVEAIVKAEEAAKAAQ
jgi:hypothetical protein